MPLNNRSPIQQEVVRALVESKAIDLEAIGAIFGKFGAGAALSGESIATIITGEAIWNCGWPGPDIGSLRNVVNSQQE